MRAKRLVRRNSDWFRLAGRMPRGFKKQTGESLGGKKKGAGRKPKPVKNVRVTLTVKPSTKAAIQKVQVAERVDLFSAALEGAVDQYLEGNR